MQRRRRLYLSRLVFTRAELDALYLALDVYGQEVDEKIHGGPDIAAFRRARDKVVRAMQQDQAGAIPAPAALIQEKNDGTL